MIGQISAWTSFEPASVMEFGFNGFVSTVCVCVCGCVSVFRSVVLSTHTARTNKPFNFPAASNCGILTFGSREQKWNGMRAKWPRMRTPVSQQHRVYTFSDSGAWPSYTDSSILKPRLHDTTCCHAGCQTGLTTGLTTGWMFVYTIQPVVKAAVQPVWQPVVLYRVNGV